MEPEEIAELRIMFVFTPPRGQSWELTFEGLEARLRERNPETFTRVDDGGIGPVCGASMVFGITFDDEDLEGLASLEPEGVSVLDCNAHLAARFALWLRNNGAPTHSRNRLVQTPEYVHGESEPSDASLKRLPHVSLAAQAGQRGRVVQPSQQASAFKRWVR
ncbi:hypothetical protein ABZ079_17215 [Streptomyces sp. NPDC006314]|uniref:hypothetical protein n=1 Tax=Streptomyces sp. NPDC006314 TaxID=3154475 RepID=UPI0033A1DD24